MRSLKNPVLICALVLLFLLFWNVQSFGQSDHPSQITCTKCDHLNPWSNNYCIKCGESLIEIKQSFSRQPKDSRPATLEIGMSRVFHLRDENIIAGTIVEIEADSIAVIETPDGLLRIPADEILSEMVDLVKQDDTHFIGPVLSEDEFSLSIKTPYGVVVVLKRDVKSMDRYYGDKKVSWQEEKQRFYSVEDLTDVFTDPTAFPLQQHTVYLSGLSLGCFF